MSDTRVVLDAYVMRTLIEMSDYELAIALRVLFDMRNRRMMVPPPAKWQEISLDDLFNVD